MFLLPTVFRRTVWRASFILTGFVVVLITAGLWLYQLERNTLLEQELQQEQTRLMQVASEMEFIFLHAWQNGQYLAKLLDYHIRQTNGQIEETQKVALQHFLASHPAFYRMSVLSAQGDIQLDILNHAAPRHAHYAAFKTNHTDYALMHSKQTRQERVVDLGMNEKTQERMLGLIYPIFLDEQGKVPGMLVILTSIHALLPGGLVSGDLAQRHMTILNDRLSALVGEIPDRAVLQVLQNRPADKERQLASEVDKLQALQNDVALHRYQLAPIHLPAFDRDWILVKKYQAESLNQPLRILSWLFGACALLLLVGFFMLTYYFILRRLEYAAKVGLPGGDLNYSSEMGIADENATKQVLVEANQVLHRLAHVDALTGLSNRRAFDFSLAREWQKASKYHEPVSLIMIDVDCFKAFNDCYGHKAGDECLQRIAQALRGEVRRMSDVVARYGGEEFALILPNTPLHDATKIARNLRQRVVDLQISHKGSNVIDVVTISCGVACIWPYHGYSVDDLLHLADQALYKAKHLGRNRVEG
jgi:diguanylate cyclase (GGDEF)-like protein